MHRFLWICHISMFVFIHLHMNPLGSDGEMGVCVQEYGFTLPSLSSCIYIYVFVSVSMCRYFQAHPCFLLCGLLSLCIQDGPFHLAFLPPSRGPARCWRRRCPAVSRLRWDSAPLGHDTRPKHTSSSSPSPDLLPLFLLWGCGSP